MRGPPPSLPPRDDATQPNVQAPGASVQQSVVQQSIVQQSVAQPLQEQITMEALPPPPVQHAVFLPPAPQVAVNQGCDCNVPADASRDVKWTRYLSIAVIGTHTVALMVYGFLLDFQWVASLCGIVSGGVLLCCYQKGVYICTPIMFIIAAIFDFLAAIWWILLASVPLALLPLLALASAVAGTVFGFKSCYSWDEAAGLTKAYTVPTLALRQASQGPVMEQMPVPVPGVSAPQV